MVGDHVHMLVEPLRALGVVMLTTVDDRHQLVSRPMAIRLGEFDGTLRFFAPTNSRCIANIAACAAVNVAYTSARLSVSLAGQALVGDDPGRIARYWHSGLNRWLPRGQSGVSLIEVRVIEGRSWQVPHLYALSDSSPATD